MDPHAERACRCELPHLRWPAHGRSILPAFGSLSCDVRPLEPPAGPSRNALPWIDLMNGQKGSWAQPKGKDSPAPVPRLREWPLVWLAIPVVSFLVVGQILTLVKATYLKKGACTRCYPFEHGQRCRRLAPHIPHLVSGNPPITVSHSVPSVWTEAPYSGTFQGGVWAATKHAGRKGSAGSATCRAADACAAISISSLNSCSIPITKPCNI